MTIAGTLDSTSELLALDRSIRGEGVFFFCQGALTRSRLFRASQVGRLRRIAHGIYTDDMVTEPLTLVRQNRWELIAHYVPDAVVSMRSAITAGAVTQDFKVFVTSPTRRRDVVLPGLLIEVHRGPGPFRDDFRFKGVPMASDARCLVENLRRTTSKGGTRASLSRVEHLQFLSDLLDRYGAAPDRVLLRAEQLSIQMGMADEFRSFMGEFAGSRPSERSLLRYGSD